jgi:hypothetical protein
MCIDVDSPLSNKLLHLTPRQHDSQVTSLRRRLDASRSAQVNSNVELNRFAVGCAVSFDLGSWICPLMRAEARSFLSDSLN